MPIRRADHGMRPPASGCRVVLLGAATHGTSEFYRARAAITRRLVERHGFTIVAAEADWQDTITTASHDCGVSPFLLDLRGGGEALRDGLLEPRLEHFIDVIYRPESERASHYAQASLPRQFDAYVWFDATRAVTLLPTSRRAGVPETHPFGM